MHAVCTVSGAVGVWAEDSTLPPRARRSRTRAPHPFAVTGEALRERLSLPADTKIDTRPLLLPTRASAPCCSPELVRDPLAEQAPSRGEVRLRPWLVPLLLCEPGSDWSTSDLDQSECRLGASARYLADLAAFAGDLVDRGRVLPTVVVDPAGPAARWRPALTGADSTRWATLRDTMPPAYRAEHVNPDVLDGPSPADALRTTVEALVDGRVRTRLTEHHGPLAPRGGHDNPAVRAWLDALTGEARFDADSGPLDALTHRLDTWQASGDHPSPVRLCFRLRSPDQHDGEDHEWILELLLQPVDEPSVLVPASHVWGGHDGVLRHWVDDPQHVLLAELGKASRLHPPLDDVLREAHPERLRLDTDGAYDFLTHCALLDQAGFGVLLPSWWGHPSELGLKLTTHSGGTVGAVAKESGAGLDELLDYRWDLALGGDALTEDEITELATAKVPLVRLRGRWVQVDQKRVAAGLSFLDRAARGHMPAGQALLHAGLPQESSELPMPVAAVSDDGWLGDLLTGRVDQHLERVEPPPGFTATLRHYQQRGLSWLAFCDRLGLGACLADDMGLGKTVQLLALEALTRAERTRPPTLLICPMSVVGNWQREAARFTPDLSVYVHHGSDRHTGDDLITAASEHDLVLTTYALAARDFLTLNELRWDRVVLDEAQTIKNSGSRQSKAARGIPARHRIALTGTPVENRLAELWSIMDFLNPGMLGSVQSFRARFAVPVERDGDKDTAARLRRITGPFILRRLKTDPRILDDLPDKLEMRQLCNLTTEQASLYKAVVDDMLNRIADSEGMQRKGLVLSTMSKLKQVCNHPAHLLGDGSPIAGRSGKLLRLEDILDEVLADGDKALCFTQFAEFGGMLVPYLGARFDTEVLFLHGATRKKHRDDMVRRFQSPGGPSIFLLSLGAGGTGLNLTAANHVIHLDRWWNPAVEDQATDRAFRIGQRRDVQVRKLTCIGTLEEKIDQMIEDKKALARLVVGAGENWLTELSTEHLRDLVTLSSEAVVE